MCCAITARRRAVATGITIGAIIKVILIAVVALIGAVIGGSILGAILVFTGSPQPCVDRDILVSATASQALQDKWDAFSPQAAVGPAQVTFTEAEVTSRGVEYLTKATSQWTISRSTFAQTATGKRPAL